jgi:hypothetical protein
METDRTIRRLTALARTASTARVLNLNATHRRRPAELPLTQSPMFQNRFLDRCILLKHRMREHEYFMFARPRRNATKLLIPIDGADLKLGARYIFVGQKDFDAVIEEVFGSALLPGTRDRRVLELIDELPSLDPFLLREHLKRHEFEPSRLYFNVSEADLGRMRAFVQNEVSALAALSSKGGDGSPADAARLVDKLLSHSPEQDFEPLKRTLKLDDKEYLDGVFAWRGFLYYKWVLSELSQPILQIGMEIAEILPRGLRDPATSTYISGARARIQDAFDETLRETRRTLDVYNRAYASLTKGGKPAAFRDFLLSAPDLFASLGTKTGALQHVASFWRYRFPRGKPKVVDSAELMDLMLDFEDSLGICTEEAARGEAA